MIYFHLKYIPLFIFQPEVSSESKTVNWPVSKLNDVILMNIPFCSLTCQNYFSIQVGKS